MKGRNIGAYRILGQLERGGMATVYVARHIRLGHVVALKVPHLDYQRDPSFRRRFVDEARIQANLRHPNILGVNDILELPDASAIIMELLKGSSLRRFYNVRGIPLPLAQIFWLFQGMSSALQHAHNEGVIHRDLKPSNVFLHVSEDNVLPKLMDFGIAKLPADLMASLATTTGTVLGTPQYMSPEQFEDASTVDRRSDIFALGIMLFECATGVFPYEGDSVGAILRAYFTLQPAKPSDLVSDFPSDLEEVIMTCLAVRKEDRFSTVSEVASALDDLSGKLGCEPIPASEVPVVRAGDKDAQVTDGLAALIEAKGKKSSMGPTVAEVDAQVEDVQEISLSQLARPLDPLPEFRTSDEEGVQADSEAGGQPSQVRVITAERAAMSGPQSDLLETGARPAFDPSLMPVDGDSIPFSIVEKIYEGTETVVYKASSSDGRPVVVKVLNAEYPKPEAVARLRREYQLMKRISFPGIAQALALQEHGNALALVIEDFGGVALREVMLQEGPGEIVMFLRRAIAVTTTLSHLHSADIVHKDINPKNIVVNRETDDIRIIDFGLASVLPRELQSVAVLGALEGTVAYISPEQSGRMNRAIDYRTDFYSLGVTFFEMLTARLPFESTDRAELVHCHMARVPVAPHEVRPTIPAMMSELVLKLMSKTPEDRYQGARGLLWDLEHCLSEFEATGRIVEFELGSHDVCDRFSIPEKLYGRETEIEELLSSFGRISQGYKEMITVSGFAGIGKTCLVREIYKPVTRQRGYFITGKFDQYKRNIPYGALIEAFQDLIRELLTEGEERLAEWRNKLQEALGPNGQVIIDVIPEVQMILGPQPPVPELPVAESLNRLNLVFRNFIGVFTLEEHPLVLFQDDLQWADSASLNLTRLLMTGPEVHYLLLIGAYRDNEVDASHSLPVVLDEIQSTGVELHDIRLGPLTQQHVNQLVADTLDVSLDRSSELARLLHAKTGGNPFFLTEFFGSLHHDGLVRFDPVKGWVWDLEQVRALGISDNVVDLMADKIGRLGASTQQALKLGACIGNRFELQILAIVSGKSPGRIMAALKEAVAEGLVLLLGDGHKYLELSEDEAAEGLLDAVLLRTVQYKFCHDKIQQAAYSLIPDDVCQTLHRQIGQLILRDTPSDQRENRIFDIVNQLNKAVELISDQRERLELAQLNLVAGKKAKASSAYASSVTYLAVGRELVKDAPWTEQYELRLPLSTHAAEAAYLCGRFSDMESESQAVLDNARELMDKVRAYEIRIAGYISQVKKMEAINTGLTVLRLLGVRLHPTPNMGHVLVGLARAKLALMGKGIEPLVDHKRMTDPRMIAAMRIATSISSTAFVAYPNLFPVLVLKQVELSARYGNATESSFAYALYGTILCGVIGDISSGYRFGKMALQLQDKFHVREMEPKVIFTAAGTSQHYIEPYVDVMPAVREGYRISLELGDFEFAATNAGMHSYALFYSGSNLFQAASELKAYADVVENLKQFGYLSYIRLFRQTMLCLMGDAQDASVLVGDAFDDEATLAHFDDVTDGHGTFNIHAHRLILRFFMGDFEGAVAAGETAHKWLFGAMAMFPSMVYPFYDAMACLALLRLSDKPPDRRMLKRIKRHVRTLRKYARFGPANFAHKLSLVQAEWAALKGNHAQATDLYDVAIAQAKESGFRHELALACERAALMYQSLDKERIARTYMTDARYEYEKWGAIAKVALIDESYPELLALGIQTAATSGESSSSTLTSSSTHASSSGAMDLSAVLKAAQAISGEIRMDTLLTRLMRIVIENAGAQVAVLILETEGRYLVEAEIKAGEEEVHILQHLPVRQKTSLAQSVINYVMRTREVVVLDNAVDGGSFSRDSYIRRNRPRSLMCLPLSQKGKLSGLLYLENNLAPGIFTQERVEVLRMLSAEIIISIENARLYRDLEDHARLLEDRVRERTRELRLANQELADEKQKSDQLLLNVLPSRVAEDLKERGTTEPESFPEVTVFLSDFVGFTRLATELEPAVLIHELNDLFTAFDSIIESNGCERIKTIGDAYLAVCGMPSPDPEHAASMVKSAVEILEYLEQRNKEHEIQWLIRIGIHSGPVVGGVVGVKKYIYDVFGDTINTASRMESMCLPMKINISDATKAHLGDRYPLVEREPVEVKGKGMMNMYFVGRNT